MVNKPLSINLLKKNNENFAEKFIHWALTIGRFVVIVTEVVALSTFLYRFSLDRRLVDLHDSIKQKTQVVKILKDNEITYRNLQERLLASSQYSENNTLLTQSMVDIINLAPPDMVFSTFIITGERVRIEGTVSTVKSLTKFINSLKSYSSVAAVSLDKIENKTSNSTIVVSITATLKSANKEVAIN